MVLYGCSLTIRETQRNVKERERMSESKRRLLAYATELLEQLDEKRLELVIRFLRGIAGK